MGCWLLYDSLFLYIMERKSIIKIGILTIIALVLLVWGLSFLKGENLFKTENEFVAVYNRLDNLAQSNPVLLSGYRIGSVKSIDFKEEDNELKIYVRFKVNDDFRLPKGTVMKIVSVDIMGTKGVDVIRPKNFTGYHENGDTLIGVVEGGIIDQLLDLIMPMKDDLAGMLLTTDSVMHAVNRLLNPQNINYIESGLRDLQEISGNLAGKMLLVDTMLVNFTKLSRTMGKNSGNIDRAIQNFAALSDTLNALELSKTLDEARTALQNVNTLLNTVNASDGTVQKFLTTDTVYNNVERLTTKLNTLIDDFEKHPKKYINLAIFGGKEKKK